ncbi:MAG: DVUA0089 family protein [Opitutales bacterium]|nr:DVUA0089 family protein [Opitutales bacterium]
MKPMFNFKKHFCLFLTALIGIATGPFAVWAELFVDVVESANVGVPVSIHYISTDRLPPDGEFNIATFAIDGVVVDQKGTTSDSFSATFTVPGSRTYEVTTYGTDGEPLDQVTRSITVFGIGMTGPADNELVPLGSKIFLSADAIFGDRVVDEVGFQYRAQGSTDYSAVPGSIDMHYPYSFLWEPSSIGVWEVRAWASHGNSNQSFSTPITIQVSASNNIDRTSVTILDPTDGQSVQAGVNRAINVDVSTHNDSVVRGVDMFVDGIRINRTEGMDVVFPFRFDWIPKRPGPYSLVAIATDNRGNKVASNEVKVTATDDRPHAELIMPANGSRFVQGKQITLVALAAGQGGALERVQEVEFLVNGNVIATDTDSPFSEDWTPTQTGSYFVQARVIDSVTSASHQSDAITVHVDAGSPPVVSLVAPYAGDTYYPGETVTLKAVAGDQTGLITGVEFFANDVSIGAGQMIDGKFELNYTFQSTGTIHFKAVATNDSGRQGISMAAMVLVSARSGSRPTVILTEPAPNERFETGDTVRLVAQANDSDGAIAEVRFYQNRQLIADGNEDTPSEGDTSFPFERNFTFPSAGHYELSTIAVDNHGNQSQRSIVDVQVVDPEIIRPNVSITSPTHEQVYEVGHGIFVQAEVHDPDGNIASVSFSIDGVPLGEPDTSYPYSSSFYTIQSPGVFEASVIAIDNDGNLSNPAIAQFYAVPPAPDEPMVFDPLSSNRDFVTQVYLDLFMRGPTGSEMNRNLEKLDFGEWNKVQFVESLYSSAEFQNMRHSQNAYHSVIGDWPTPLEFSASLQGIDLSTAENEIPSTGEDDVGDTFNEALLLDQAAPSFTGVLESLGDVDMFQFVVTNETLVTVSTTGPFDPTGTLYNSGRTVLEFDDNSGDFFNFAIQRVLKPGNYYIAVAGWAGTRGSYTLTIRFGESTPLPTDSGVSNESLNQTIAYLYNSPKYLNSYDPVQELVASDLNRRSMFRQLFVNRYDQEPTQQQLLQASSRMLVASSLEVFTGAFLRNDKVGLNDYIYNLPDVQGAEDAAFLIRSFFKRRPNDVEVEELSVLTLEQQIESILSDQEYRLRFDPVVAIDAILEPMSLSQGGFDEEEPVFFELPGQGEFVRSPFSNPEKEEDGWKYLGWFGWYSDAHYPWIYHEQLEWIEVIPIQEREFWMWHQLTDWVYTSSDVFPFLFDYEKEEWVEVDLENGVLK